MNDGERRQISRRTFSYYMRVLDDASGKLIGHLSDISKDGFKLDSKYAVPLNVDLRLRIDQTNAISNKSFLVFTARARWCQRDIQDPTLYNVGFQLIQIDPSDYAIFAKMFEAYGTQVPVVEEDDGSLDYLFS
jgi:hypothetical protein